MARDDTFEKLTSVRTRNRRRRVLLTDGDSMSRQEGSSLQMSATLGRKQKTAYCRLGVQFEPGRGNLAGVPLLPPPPPPSRPSPRLQPGELSPLPGWGRSIELTERTTSKLLPNFFLLYAYNCAVLLPYAKNVEKP